MAKFTLTLTKTFEVDTSTWHVEGLAYLRQFLTPQFTTAPPTEQLHDAIYKALAEDMESVGADLGMIDEDDFKIEVTDPILESE